ncbi:hypothetical protein AVEN_105636-1, partial [Araneus ventricosus]
SNEFQGDLQNLLCNGMARDSNQAKAKSQTRTPGDPHLRRMQCLLCSCP